MDRHEALASLRLEAKLDAQRDDEGEPVFIGLCRDLGSPHCNQDDPTKCDNCFRFWHDDPRTDEELLADMDRKH